MYYFAILISEHSAASVVHGLYDLFCSQGRDWEILVEGKKSNQGIKPVLVSRDGKPVTCANGIWLKPEASLHDIPQPDVLIIPELALTPGQKLLPDYQEEVDWIKKCHNNGCLIATACTGAFLMAESSLLDGQEVTTHWALNKHFTKQYPDTKVSDKLPLIITGEQHQIIMAGGATSFLDLGVYLIARFMGVEQAMRVARIWLINWHDNGQQPYASFSQHHQKEDATITECQQWLAMNYETQSPVNTMCEISGLTEKSFKRRFRSATGLSPIDYAHALRIEEAKQVLESTDLPIEAIAQDVGYSDSSFFGRLFKRRVGLTPNQYRKKFRTMRQSLVKSLQD